MGKTPLECETCGSVYNPFMNLDGDVFCPICEKFIVLKNDDLKNFDIFKQNNALLKELDDQLREIEYPGELFLGLITALERHLGEFSLNAIYPLSFLEFWVQYQSLLERLILLNLDISRLHPILPDKREKINFSYIWPYLEEGIKANRWLKDIADESLIYARNINQQTAEFLPYMTSKKMLVGTPIKLTEYIFRKNPLNLINIRLDFRGLKSSILNHQSPHLQTLNIGSKLWTDFIKFSSTLPFHDVKIPHIELIPHWLKKFAEILEEAYRVSTRVENVIIFPEQFLKPVEKLLFHEMNFILRDLKIGYDEANFLKFSKKVQDYFSEPGYFRCLIYHQDKNLVISPNSLKIFSLMIESQIEFQRDRKLKGDVRKYRGLNFEKRIWQLGSHLNIENILKDGTPLVNVVIPAPRGNSELDVIFYEKKTLELIECKSDLVINPLLQEKYYRKLLKKTDLFKDYFENLGYDIDKVNNSIISHVCGKKPPDNINVFISILHFLESFVKRYGLFEWNAESYFQKYPIIAQLGWSNMDVLEFYSIPLNSISKNEFFYLCRGEFKKNQVLFYDPHDKSEKLFKLPDDNIVGIEDDEIDVLIIWDSSNHQLIDYLLLPPYWNEPYIVNVNLFNTAGFHNSVEGQRFLSNAILNGVFGYCSKCKFIPLIPFGRPYKPHQYSAKGLCIRCQNNEKIERFDITSFRDYPDLIKKITNSLTKKYGNLNIKL